MHCIVFGSLSVAGVEEEEDGVVAATKHRTSLRGAFSPALALALISALRFAPPPRPTSSQHYGGRTPKSGQVAKRQRPLSRHVLL